MKDLEKVARSMLTGLVEADERGVFNTVNQDMCELFGYTRDEFIGTSLTLIQPHRFRAGHAKGFTHYVKTRESVGLLDKRLEVFGLHKTGYEFPISVHVTVKDVGGHLLFANEIRDITLQREQERGKKFTEPPVFTNLFNILLVEADFAAQEALIGELRAHRIANRIIVVSSVAEAEDFVFARNEYLDRAPLPYIVLLSLLLPDVGGLALLRTLRANSLQAPVVITTVLPRSQEMDELIALGDCVYLRKPIQFNDLTAALTALDVNWVIGRRAK